MGNDPMTDIEWEIDQNQMKVLETTDWFYEFTDDHKAFMRGKETYQNAISVLMGMSEPAQEASITKYVPKDMQEVVRKALRNRHH